MPRTRDIASPVAPDRKGPLESVGTGTGRGPGPLRGPRPSAPRLEDRRLGAPRSSGCRGGTRGLAWRPPLSALTHANARPSRLRSALAQANAGPSRRRREDVVGKHWNRVRLSARYRPCSSSVYGAAGRGHRELSTGTWPAFPPPEPGAADTEFPCWTPGRGGAMAPLAEWPRAVMGGRPAGMSPRHRGPPLEIGCGPDRMNAEGAVGPRNSTAAAGHGSAAGRGLVAAQARLEAEPGIAANHYTARDLPLPSRRPKRKQLS
jgi:hypothetical protein